MSKVQTSEAMGADAEMPVEVLKPAIWPDDWQLFAVILAVEVAGIIAGLVMHNKGVVFLSAGAIGILPGISLFFHTLFHLGVRLELFNDTMAVKSWMGDRFLQVPRRQEIAYSDIAHVYYLDKELKAASHDPGFLRQTKVDMKKYQWESTRARGYVGTARTKACLVLSNDDGSQKVYFPNLYDLSGPDQRRFFEILKMKNPSIEFLFNPNQAKRLLS